METVEMLLPAHWAAALINGDETGFDDEEQEAFDTFCSTMESYYGSWFAIDVSEDVSFVKNHDAAEYGVLACDCATITFDITEYRCFDTGH